MNEEFLLGLGLEQSVSDAILAEYNAERLNTAVTAELDGAGVCDRAAAEALLDRDGLCAENLSDRVAALKREHPSLFKSAAPRIVSSATAEETVEKGDFEKMTYRQRLELYKKSPDVYKKLVQ
ncbi:MAG: hypothetical protein IJ366_08395 [Clostridia bacterium]|nr:hypothetical protein [Clostridia bacterium]